MRSGFVKPFYSWKNAAQALHAKLQWILYKNIFIFDCCCVCNRCKAAPQHKKMKLREMDAHIESIEAAYRLPAWLGPKL